jgi:hypothetical protein
VRLNVEGLEDRLTPSVTFQPRFGAESLVPNHTGPVLSSTPVNLIFEGSYWLNPTGITEQDVINNVNNILGSRYLSGLGQYGSNGVAYLAGTSYDNSLPLSKNAFTEGNLQNIALGRTQPFFTSANFRPLYFVVTAPGVSDGTRTGLGGYHKDGQSYASLGFFTIPEQIPYGWVGDFGTTRSTEIDSFSRIFSHELVESITDPYIFSNDANRVYPGARWTSSETYDEIGDFEPDSQYVYRLSNGTQVQAYWSQKDGKFIVPDGTSQAFSLLPRYGIKFSSLIFGQGIVLDQNNFLNSFDLTVNGDQLASKSDTITISTITSGPQAGGVSVNLDGETVSFDAGQLHSIIVNTGAGYDTVNIESLPANVSLSINLGSGQDAVNFSPTAQNLDGVQGPVNIQGGAGTSTVTLQDHGAADRVGILSTQHSLGYSIQGNGLTRSDYVVSTFFLRSSSQYYQSNINFAGISRLVIFGGNCATSYYVNTDTLSTPLTLWGTNAHNRLYFDDSTHADSASRYLVTNGSISRTDSKGTALVNFYNIPDLNLNAGASASNELDIQSVGFGTQQTVYTGPRANTILVGSATASLDDIAGALTLYGAGLNTLALNDTAVQNTDFFINQITFTLTDAGIVRTNTVTVDPGDGAFSFTNTATINYANIQSIVLEGSATGNTFNVQSTALGVAITIDTGAGDDLVNVLGTGVGGSLGIEGGGGNDLVRIGGISEGAGDTAAHAGNLGAIQGQINVGNSAGVTALVIDDSGDSVAYPDVEIDAFSLSGVAPALIGWSVSQTTIYLGGTAGAPGNTVNINANPGLQALEIFTGPGDDTINVNDPYAYPNAFHTLTIHGQDGNDTLNINDQNALDDATYAMEGDVLTRTSQNPDLDLASVLTINTDAIENLALNLGGGNDLLLLQDMDPAILLAINAGTGSYTLG